MTICDRCGKEAHFNVEEVKALSHREVHILSETGVRVDLCKSCLGEFGKLIDAFLASKIERASI